MYRKYLILFLALFLGGSLGIFADEIVTPHPKPFVGERSGSIIERIGSLSIGSNGGGWLSNNTSSSFRDSCINKWTTEQGDGSETCLDVNGGAVFDSLFVHQPAYFLGRLILNQTITSGEPSGVVIGTQGHSGNSILITDLVNQNQNLQNLCANARGEIYICGGSQPQTFTWRTDDWGPCTNGTQTRNVWCENNGGQTVNNNRCSGAQPATTQSCGNPDNGPLSWNGNPYRQCENGRVIAYIGVTGAEGQPVEFRRGSNGPWMNANNGNNGFTYEIPKYDNPNDTMPDTYCKEFRYRVPNLPNKSTNDVNNGVWGCVNTMTRTECPD